MAASAVPNSRLIKRLRQTASWSQEELAHRSGLSVRTVATIEKGRAVASASIEAVASAFRAAGIEFGSIDLTADPEKLTLEFLKNYAIHQANCSQHCLDFLSPDIVAVVAGDPATNPIAGTYRGIAEFDRLWRKFFSIFYRIGGTLVESPEIKCIGNEVIVWGYEEISLHGVPSKGPAFVLLKLQFKEGKIIHFEDHYEENGMMLALSHYADRFPEADWAKVVRKRPFAWLEPSP